MVLVSCDCHLYTQVVAHHEDLLSQVTGIEALEGALTQAYIAAALHNGAGTAIPVEESKLFVCTHSVGCGRPSLSECRVERL